MLTCATRIGSLFIEQSACQALPVQWGSYPLLALILVILVLILTPDCDPTFSWILLLPHPWDFSPDICWSTLAVTLGFNNDYSPDSSSGLSHPDHSLGMTRFSFPQYATASSVLLRPIGDYTVVQWCGSPYPSGPSCDRKPWNHNSCRIGDKYMIIRGSHHWSPTDHLNGGSLFRITGEVWTMLPQVYNYRRCVACNQNWPKSFRDPKAPLSHVRRPVLYITIIKRSVTRCLNGTSELQSAPLTGHEGYFARKNCKVPTPFH